MLSIFNTSFAINRDLTIVVGLKLINNVKFEVRIGILFHSEKVIFSTGEWKSFLSICNKKFGMENKPSDEHNFMSICNLSNHEVMLNMDSEETEVVVKSNITWNTVRINSKQMRRINDWQHCIGEYVQFIDGLVEYANFCLNKIISETHQEIVKVLDTSYTLYAECVEMQLSVPHPPNIEERDILNELKKKLGSDRMMNEIISFYDSKIIGIIISKF